MNWSYGITTCPSRLDSVFPQTLGSLLNAGFTSPRIFIDGYINTVKWNGLPVTSRESSVGANANWVLAAWELYLRNPSADAYAVFQDDIICYKNLRQYIERTWRLDLNTFLNLYRPPTVIADGVKWCASDQKGRGALALVFSRQAFLTLFAQQPFIYHAQDAKYRNCAIDRMISDSMRNANYIEYIHNPSLVQHREGPSSISTDQPVHALATSFRGEDYDALELLK